MSASTSRQPSDDETPPAKVQKRNSFLPSFDGGHRDILQVSRIKARMVAAGQMDDHKEKMLKYSEKAKENELQIKSNCLRHHGRKKRPMQLRRLSSSNICHRKRMTQMMKHRFIVRPLTWRSDEYTNCLRALDAKHKTTLSQQGKRVFNRRKTGAPSTRPRPENVSNSNDWVIKK
ncbi:unnamed protein product [Mytilus edulis]|uniref:Uncharacterized protein n=1 Tax=Mytilus edulis TaxID=6550 RepID=A0A8S3U6G5_MYTED|nr:unnamed protein product [Mytilus edulis]